MTPNWFVGFPVPMPISLDRLLACAPPSVARVAAEDLHATLAFMGAVSEARARASWRVAAHAAKSLSSVQATLGPVVPMGAPDRWSALSALLAQGHDEIADAIARMRAPILDAALAQADTRPPRPHVTLARIGRQAGRREREAALSWASSLDLGAPPVRLDRLALYTWSPDRGARRFRIVEDAPLGED